VGTGGGGGGGGGGGMHSGGGGMGAGPNDISKPFLVCRPRLVRITDNYTKLVWFKVGFKGAIAKVGRAFNASVASPSDQSGAVTFDLLQVRNLTDPIKKMSIPNLPPDPSQFTHSLTHSRTHARTRLCWLLF
jgi:hypothetical protein